VIDEWREKARHLKRETRALHFAVRDPRVPWYAKALAAGVVGYAFSPIDLIPDFIPILGYLDELVILPLGVMAVRALIPANVLAECRDRAKALEGKPRNWLAATVIVAVWIALAVAGGYCLAARLGWTD
jgi:uncharacterized membrane protein YkvA (DUF1232 family)